MDELKKSLEKNKWFILVIVLIVGWFYWFHYKPLKLKSYNFKGSARKESHLYWKKAAHKKAVLGKYGKEEMEKMFKDGKHLEGDYDGYHEKRLHTKKLKQDDY